MQPFITAQRSAIAELCRRYHVRRLDVFGSAAGDDRDFDPARSDIDLLVEFERDAPGHALDLYFGLKESLEAVLDRPVDLVIGGAVRNPYLRAGINRSREALYAA